MNIAQKNCLSEKVEIITAKSLDEINSIRPIWEKMQNNEPYPVINAEIDRYLTVHKYRETQEEPYVAIVKKEGMPALILIGRFKKQPLILKLGYKSLFSPKLKCLSIVYGGILGQQTGEVCELVVNHLISLLKQKEADLIFFNHLSIDSEIYNVVRKIPNILSRSYLPKVQSHWQTHIPGSVEEFYKNIPSKHKREWRRCERKLANAADGLVEVTCYRDESQIDEVMKIACNISRQSYKHAMNVGISDNPLTRSMLSQAARKGTLRAYILYVNNVPCAFEFGIHYEEIFFVEYMGYDKEWRLYGPGALLWVKAIEDLCTDNVTNLLDYGFGDAPYKQRLGTKVWQEASVCIFAARLYPIAVNMLLTVVTGLSLMLNYISDKAGITIWLKRRWRSLLQKRVSANK